MTLAQRVLAAIEGVTRPRGIWVVHGWVVEAIGPASPLASRSAGDCPWPRRDRIGSPFHEPVGLCTGEARARRLLVCQQL